MDLAAECTVLGTKTEVAFAHNMTSNFEKQSQTQIYIGRILWIKQNIANEYYVSKVTKHANQKQTP